MSREGTAATAATNDPAAATAATGGDNPGGSDPREAALGDAGAKLLKEMRQELKDRDAIINDLKTRVDGRDAAEAEAERKRKDKEAADLKAAEEKDLNRVQLLEKQLEEERAERRKFESKLSERFIREDFLEAATAAGVRDEQAAKDLYKLTRDDIGNDPDRIAEVIQSNIKTRPAFFKENPGTQGHDGAAGAGGEGKAPRATKDEAAAAAMLGVPIEEYLKNK